MEKSKSDKGSSVTKRKGVRKGQRKKQEKTAAKQSPATKSALKRRGAKTKASPKNNTAPKSVDAYLAAVPEPARSALNQIREAIRSVVPPDATEIISYKIPAFKHKKVLVWYAAFSNHCSLFPTAAVIEEFKDELKGYTVSKGTVQFPLDKPMPLELIKRMVKARVANIASKKPH